MGLNIERGNRSFSKRSKLDIKYNFRKRIYGDTENSCSNCKKRRSMNNIPNHFRCRLLKRRVYHTNVCDALDKKKKIAHTKRYTDTKNPVKINTENVVNPEIKVKPKKRNIKAEIRKLKWVRSLIKCKCKCKDGYLTKNRIFIPFEHEFTFRYSDKKNSVIMFDLGRSFNDYLIGSMKTDEFLTYFEVLK